MQLQDVAKTFTRKELPDSVVELSGEIPAEVLAPHRQHALEHIAAEIEMPGFRKGHVPADIALKKVGEVGILEEAVEFCMRDLYPLLLDTHNVDAVGRPDIRITKLAPGNPVGITIHATIYPTVTLPKTPTGGWKNFAGKIETETVSDVLDAEVDEALNKIRAARATVPTSTTDSLSKTSADEVDSSAAGQQGNAAESTSSATVLPTLDDAFAQSLGQFADLADLKVKLKENMKQEKEQKAKEARRGKIIDALLEKTTVAVPAIFVDSELEKIIGQMKEDVQRFGLSFDEYLTRMQKTESAVRDEFREQAAKRAKLQLALNKLAEEEKIEADKETADAEMKHAMEHFPDARPELVRVHIETVLRNEKTLQLLEGSDKKE